MLVLGCYFIFLDITTEEWGQGGNIQKASKLTQTPSAIAGTVQLSFYFHPVSCFFHSL